MECRSEKWWLALSLSATFLLRLLCLDQPIWEGYIGRQVPTAMVARNLLRDGEFLAPKVDTGPFPSLFLVEPPIYTGVVVLIKRVTGLGLEPTGRLISALSVTLGAWGLFGLVRRREGLATAFATIGFFAFFPVMIRYGRAFQPDALMVGLTVAGLRCWDDRRPFWGWIFVGIGLATKVTGAFILIPFVLCRMGLGPPSGSSEGESWSTRRVSLALAATMLLPALSWYLYAGQQLNEASASAGNAANWWSRLSAFGSASWGLIARDLLLRAFTPIGFVVVLLGLTRWRSLNPLWRSWVASAGLTLLVLAGKLHHEYYWMMAAPVFAVLASLGLLVVWRIQRGTAVAVFLIFVSFSLFQTRSTWSTPVEWRGLIEAGREIREATGSEELVIAPEALLYAADRRGCRLEWEPSAIRRASTEWRSPLIDSTGKAESLVRFYQRVAGASVFADLQPNGMDARRRELHQTLRKATDAQILIDKAGGLLLIRFTGPNASDRQDL